MLTKNKIPIVNIILTIIAMLAIGGFFFYISGRFAYDTVEIYPEEGIADLSKVDTDNTMIRLVNFWDFYPDRLYAPEDFKDGRPEGYDFYAKDRPYGTYRVELELKPDIIVELAGYSIDYGTRVFVNGEECLNIGYVDADPEKAVPGSRFMKIPIYTGDGRVEVIYQYSNYFHNDGGFIQATYISSPRIIDLLVGKLNILGILIGGGLIFLGLYFLLSAAVMKNPEFAALAICSFVMSARNQYFLLEYILPESMPYAVAYRFFILIVSMIPIASVYLFIAFYRKTISKWVISAFGVVTTVLIVLHFVLDSHDMVKLCISSFLCTAAGALVMLPSAAVYYFKRRDEWTIAETATISAIFLLVGAMIYEGLYTGRAEAVAHYGTTQSWLILCILILAIVINVRSVRQERMLREEIRRNEVLGQINTMNRDFLQNVAHELRTPLTVISGYAQLMELQAQRGKSGADDPERLKTIRNEADRLGEMVTKLMDYTFGNKGDVEFSDVYAADLLKSAAAILKPVCAKRSNTLDAVNESKRPMRANFELVLQVIINLVVNANRHTDKGKITISVRDIPGNVEFTVADTGSGIAPEVAEHIFERGFTKDGGTGLGLAICSDTMRLHGGMIKLKSTGPGGSEFVFEVPCKSE
ncbi:MAG: HAMP domain-containing histidine kinase [Lachnospiraceae bacterium]|nr:HAMP domain-containing histidine kinase [Lachnospiraceae bacterium]